MTGSVRLNGASPHADEMNSENQRNHSGISTYDQSLTHGSIGLASKTSRYFYGNLGTLRRKLYRVQTTLNLGPPKNTKMKSAIGVQAINV